MAPPTASPLEFNMPLPHGYLATEVLRFHGRDKEAVSEVVGADRIRKGVLLNGIPTLFDITVDHEQDRAHCVVMSDGRMPADIQAQSEQIISGLLGLTIDPQAFAAFVETDPLFGPLTARQSGLRIAQSASIFEALTWAIMGQQINVAFAVSLRRTFVQLAGQRHSGGLMCYPDPSAAARLSLEELTSRQFSRSKAETLLRLAACVASGDLDLQEGPSNQLETIGEALLSIKGIGPWTVNYALLRGYGHADCALHGDVAIRAAIGHLQGLDDRPTMPTAEAFLNTYRPHRTMAAAHLWASLNTHSAF